MTQALSKVISKRSLLALELGQQNNMSYQIIEDFGGIRNKGKEQPNIIAFLTYL